MRLLIAVPAYRHARVRDAAPSGWAVALVSRLANIDAAMRAHAADIAVVDPLLDHAVDESSLMHAVRTNPGARWLIYTQLRPDTARLLLDLGSAGVRSAVFAGVDDSTLRLRSLLGELAQESITHRAQTRIMALVGRLPFRLRVALEQCIRDDARLAVADLAARACMTRRTLERHFMRAGLPTPKTILLTARVLTAYRLLYDGTRTCNGVAKTLGYGKASTLRAHLERAFGVGARALRSVPAPEAAISALLERQTARHPRAAPPVRRRAGAGLR